MVARRSSSSVFDSWYSRAHFPSMPKKKQLWSGRFKEAVYPQVKEFTASVSFDKRLALFDIQGSLAHARMLAARKVISRRDAAAIERGLGQVRREIEAGRFAWSV